MRYKIIRQRKKQRVKLARSIKTLRSMHGIMKEKKYNDSMTSLKGIIKNYPKLKQKMEA